MGEGKKVTSEKKNAQNFWAKVAQRSSSSTIIIGHPMNRWYGNIWNIPRVRKPPSLNLLYMPLQILNLLSVFNKYSPMLKFRNVGLNFKTWNRKDTFSYHPKSISYFWPQTSTVWILSKVKSIQKLVRNSFKTLLPLITFLGERR